MSPRLTLSTACIALLTLAATAGGQNAAQRPQPFIDATGMPVLRDDAARAYAIARGWPLTLENGSAVLAEIRNGRPQYLADTNLDALVTSSIDHVWSLGANPFQLDGAGVVIGQWESGGARVTHNEYSGRVTLQEAGMGVTRHASHVAGTLVASGADEDARGVAPAATINSWTSGNDNPEMDTAAQGGLRASNHSYGFFRGWEWDNGISTWRWWGDTSVSNTEDYLFGFYDSNSQTWDQIVIDNPRYLVCKAAGNQQNDNGPPAGSNHLVMNSSGTWVSSTTTRNIDGPWDTLPQKSVAKNVLTVAAVEDIPGGYSSPGDVVAATFTSFGPADDSRIKPDIAANGVELHSATNTGDDQYDTLSGTSMATPVVTGTAALLIDKWRESIFIADPDASTLKAILINATDEAGDDPGPDYRFGWGLLNAERAIQRIDDWQNGNTVAIREDNLSSGEVIEIEFVPTRPNVRTTVVWTDPVGTPPAAAIDPATPMLVNDIDTRIIGPDASGGSIYPWNLTAADPDAPAFRGDNDRDNVEQIDATLQVGRVYRLRISHEGALTGAQAVSIVIDGADPAPTVLHVDASSPGGGGSSWADAYSSLGDALNSATGITGPVEIWLASGMYVPTQESTPGDPDSRAFVIPEWVGLHGGFDGTESWRAERDPDAAPSILSGDINGDDGPGMANRSDNVNSVVLIDSLTDRGAELTGLTISGGAGAGGGVNIADSTNVRIRDCRFTDNHGLTGGALSAAASTVRIERCDFDDNSGASAGALYASGGDVRIVESDFRRNMATSDGGALRFSTSSGAIANCRFLGNATSGGWGGAVSLSGSSTPVIQNSTFTGNFAARSGGAIDVYNDAEARIFNCSLAGNHAEDGGGGFNIEDVNFAGASNVILWDNTDANAIGDDNQIRLASDGVILLTWSNVQGGFAGINVTDDLPHFVNARGYDDVYGTDDDNLRLTRHSPLIDIGNNAALEEDSADLDGDGVIDEDVTIDHIGVPRVVAGVIDIGAFEFDPDNLPVIHVHPDGSGAGAAWSDATDTITGATVLAALSARPVEIWIAEGTYTPVVLFGGRDTSVVLEAGVSIVGGFDGTETMTHQRDPVANPVTLSGDFDDDDAPGFANRNDNAYHVVNAAAADATSALVGVTVSGGYADGADPDQRVGGGVNIDEGELLIRDCRIRDNFAQERGGGVHVNFGRAHIRDADITDNRAGNGGGASMRTDGSTFERVSLTGNHALNNGGGLSDQGESTFRNVRLTDNTADSRGGGLYTTSSDSVFINTLIANNHAPRGGGVGTSQHADVTFINATIAHNTAESGAGGLDANGVSANPHLINSIVAGNDATAQSGLADQIIESIFTAVSADDSLIEDLNASIAGARSFDGEPDFNSPAAGDFTLGAQSDAIDVGNNDSLPDDLMTDLAGNARRIDATYAPDGGVGAAPFVDLGAFEAPAAAPVMCPGDVNDDMLVNFDDVNLILEEWGGLFDFDDLNVTLENWGASCL